MAKLACGAPSTRVREGMTEYQRVCARPAFSWTVSKAGHTERLVRCNEHAEQLRKRGYDVRIADRPDEKPAKRKWDLTSTNSLEAAASYLRKNSSAVLVLVLRAGDAVVAVDQGISARDVPLLVQCCLHEALSRLEQQQEGKHA